MSLKERIYSMLVVSATETFNSALIALLPESTYYPIHTVSNISTAKRALAERAFDFVIINAPLPDDVGIRFAIDTCASKQTVVLILTKSDVHDGIFDKVAEHGVFTLVKPVSKSLMLQALGWMISAR